MADNTQVIHPSVSPGGDTIATDDIGGIKYQRAKITLGADGVNDGDVSAANPMPVSAVALPLPSGAATAANQQTDALTNTQLRAVAVPVSAASLPLPAGAATADNQTNGLAKVQITDFPEIFHDAFGRLRTGNPARLFDAQLTYQINLDVWDTKTAVSGTVAHNATLRAATLTAAASNGSQAIMQSHYCPPYSPGRSHLAFITFVLGATPSAGVSRRVGLYNETDDIGIYLEQTSSAVNLVLKSGTGYSTQTIPQASWNIDPMNGSGPSGITLNLANTQILVINYQALYVGRVVIAFDIDGAIVPVHQFLHANVIAIPYIAQASLPVHYSIRTTSGSGGTMTAICSSVMNEGGDSLDNIPARNFTTSNGITSVTRSARQAVLSIRCKQQINSLNQNAVLIPITCGIVASTNAALVEIVRNGALGGTPAWGDVDATFSTAQVDVAGTTVTGGTVIDSFYALSGSGAARGATDRGIGGKVVLCYSHLLGAGDILSVVVTPFTGSTVVNATLTWKEIR